MLRWNCYFKESVTESAVENHRVRKCTIYMYLEDESVHVEEPRQPNSGIPQGVFLKRHRVPKDNEGGVFGPADISVGSTCTMYGRTFFVVPPWAAVGAPWVFPVIRLWSPKRNKFLRSTV